MRNFSGFENEGHDKCDNFHTTPFFPLQFSLRCHLVVEKNEKKCWQYVCQVKIILLPVDYSLKN